MKLLQNGKHGQVHAGVEKNGVVEALCTFRNRKNTNVFDGNFKEVTCPKCRLLKKVG